MTYASSEPPKEQMIPASVASRMIDEAVIARTKEIGEWLEANTDEYGQGFINIVILHKSIIQNLKSGKLQGGING